MQKRIPLAYRYLTGQNRWWFRWVMVMDISAPKPSVVTFRDMFIKAAIIGNTINGDTITIGAIKSALAIATIAVMADNVLQNQQAVAWAQSPCYGRSE